MNVSKERFKERAYPICKPFPHEPDIKIGYYEPPTNQYRLYCKSCDQRGQEAIPHNELSDTEKDNADKLVAKKK